MTNKKELTKHESKHLNQQTDSNNAEQSPVKVEFILDKETNQFTIKDNDKQEIINAFLSAFGTKDVNTASTLMSNLRKVLGDRNHYNKQDLDFAFSFIQSLNVHSPIEAMLAIQMYATHMKACSCLHNFSITGQTVEGVIGNTNLATKLTRTFISQMDALKKFRSHGEQKITVKHINVNDGGKAVIDSTINNQISNNSN